MLTINGITVRLGGRTILDRATAAIPPGSRVGLIGRNGAGKSTLMKAIIGQIDPDEGAIEMPRRTRLGYIAQEAPSGTATPFETVLAADVERARADRRGRNLRRSASARRHPRPAARDRRLQRAGARRAHPARPRLRRGRCRRARSTAIRAAGRCASRSPLCCSPQPDLLLLDEPSNHLDLEATLWLENFLKSYAGTLIVISHERDLLNNVVDTHPPPRGRQDHALHRRL